MKKILILLVLISSTAFGQVTIAWQKEAGSVNVAVDAANNVYTLTYEYNLGKEMVLTKHDANGNFLWTSFYNQTDNTKWERAAWVATDNEGNAIVTGTYMSGFSNPVEAASIVMKFNSSGTLLWRVVYENSFDGSSVKKCLVDADNYIYVLGKGVGPNGLVTKVKKFDPNGVALWSFFDEGLGAPINFKFTPDNKIVISMRSIFGSINGYEKIDLDGNKIWGLGSVYSLTVGDLAGDALGNTFLVHTEYISNGTTQIKKLDPDGNILWDKIFPIAGSRIEVGSDNQAMVSGFPNVNSVGAAFIKVDENGNLLWTNADADGPLGLMLHGQLLLDKYNNGYLAAGTLFEMAVCKINNDGTNSWTALVSPGGYATGIAMGNGINSVFVSGGITTARLNDLTILPCVTPTNIYFSNVSASTITVNWDLVNGALKYEVWRKKSSTGNWKIATVDGSKNFKKYKNLNCNTSFDFKVRSICDAAATNLSEFTAIYTQATSACKLGEEESISKSEIAIYPNPVHDLLTIDLQLTSDFSGGKVELIDINGRILITKPINDAEAESLILDVSDVPAGIYILKFTDGISLLIRRVVIE